MTPNKVHEPEGLANGPPMQWSTMPPSPLPSHMDAAVLYIWGPARARAGADEKTGAHRPKLGGGGASATRPPEPAQNPHHSAGIGRRAPAAASPGGLRHETSDQAPTLVPLASTRPREREDVYATLTCLHM